MANPYLAEIRIFAGNFAPKGWALCNGQILPISQNTALFSLLGTNYGGNGTSNFGLPNLQGMAPMHWGNGAGLTPRVIGETGGEVAVGLTSNQVGVHQHGWLCGAAGSKGENNTVTGEVNADTATGTFQAYATTSSGPAMSPGLIQPTQASGSHENRQPYQVLNFIIALQGVFPPRS